MKTLTYQLLCTGAGNASETPHRRTAIGLVRILDLEDDAGTFRMTWQKAKSADFRQVTGVFELRCPRCGRNPKVYYGNLAKILVGISDTTGVFRVDIARYQLDRA